MKNIFYSTLHHLPVRYSLAFVAMAGSVSVALADGKISMSDFAVVPGREITVAVNLDQTGDIYGLQADIALPTGLEFVAAKANSSRIDRESYAFSSKKMKEDGGEYRFLVTPLTQYAIDGNEGALFEITLKATDEFAGGNIKFYNVVLSNTSAVKTKQDDFKVSVAPSFDGGGFSVAADLITITENGGPYTVEVSLANEMLVKGLQGTINLPEGLSIKQNEKGRYVFNYGDRLPANATLSYNDENGAFTLVDMTTTQDWGHEGMLFSFEVVPDQSKLAYETEIVLTDFILSSKNDDGVQSDAKLVVKVDNAGSYAALDRTVAGLWQSYEDTKAFIQDVCPDVQDEFVAELDKIVPQIEALEKVVADAKAAKLPVSQVELDAEAVEAVEAAMEAVQEKAKAAQGEKRYAWYQEQLETLAIAYNDTYNAISKNCPDVAANTEIVEALAAVKHDIDFYTEKVKGSKPADALYFEFGEDEFTRIDEALEKVLTDAKAAQSDYTYGVYDAKVADLQEAYAATANIINTYCADVAEQFAEEMAAIKANIESFVNTIAKQKAAGKPAGELQFGMEEFEAVDKQLEEILGKAKAAQSDFTYAAYEAKVAELQEAYAATANIINTYCADVAEQYAEELAAIEANINSFANTIAKSKEAGKYAEELQFGMEEFEAVDKQLEDILGKAKAAQSDFTYAAYEAKVAELAENCEYTQFYINTYCADVAEQYAEEMAAIAANIESFKTIIAEQKAAGKYAEELQFGMEEFEAVDQQLEEVLAKAKAAQSDFTYAAYEAKVAELAALYEEVSAELAANCPDVAEQYAAQLAEIGANIEIFSATIAEAKAAGTPASQLAFGEEEFAAVKDMLDTLITDATKAQKKLNSDKLYAEYEATMTELYALYEEVSAELPQTCPDVAADYEEVLATAKTTLDDMAAAIAEAKAAGYLADETGIASELASLKDQIEQIIIDATKAQKKVNSDKLYAEYEAQMKELYNLYAEVNAELTTNCPDVVGQYGYDMAVLKTTLDDLTAAIMEAKAAGYYADETGFASQMKEISDKLNEIITEATIAQKKINSERLYAEYESTMTQLYADYDAAKATIEKECASVAPMYAETLATVKTTLDDMAAAIAEAKAAGMLADEIGITSEFDTISETLAALVSEAKAAQKEYTDLYTAYSAQVAGVQTALDDAIKTIETECKDVAANYKDAEAKIQGMIDELKAKLEAANADGSLFDFVLDVTEIEDAIKDMVQAAKDAQSTVGISLIELEGNNDVRIYTTDGKQQSQLVKGQVNIVRMSDGTVKKIFVK